MSKGRMMTTIQYTSSDPHRIVVPGAQGKSEHG